MARSRGRGIAFLDVLPEDGERRLMLAVLIDAIQSYSRYRTRVAPLSGYKEWRSERAWFQADDPSNPFSFSSICAALGLNAEYVRRCVLRPPDSRRPVKVRRYAAKAEESWIRQRRTRPLVEAVGQASEAEIGSRSHAIETRSGEPPAAASYCV